MGDDVPQAGGSFVLQVSLAGLSLQVGVNCVAVYMDLIGASEHAMSPEARFEALRDVPGLLEMVFLFPSSCFLSQPSTTPAGVAMEIKASFVAACIDLENQSTAVPAGGRALSDVAASDARESGLMTWLPFRDITP